MACLPLALVNRCYSLVSFCSSLQHTQRPGLGVYYAGQGPSTHQHMLDLDLGVDLVGKLSYQAVILVGNGLGKVVPLIQLVCGLAWGWGIVVWGLCV